MKPVAKPANARICETWIPRARLRGVDAGALGGQPLENQSKGHVDDSTRWPPLATTKVSRHFLADTGTMIRLSQFGCVRAVSAVASLPSSREHHDQAKALLS